MKLVLFVKIHEKKIIFIVNHIHLFFSSASFRAKGVSLSHVAFQKLSKCHDVYDIFNPWINFCKVRYVSSVLSAAQPDKLHLAIQFIFS